MSKKLLALIWLSLIFIGMVSAQTTQTFTSSGTFVALGGVTYVTVRCWGGSGGGGNSANGTTNGGSGGGGGAFVQKVVTAVGTSRLGDHSPAGNDLCCCDIGNAWPKW